MNDTLFQDIQQILGEDLVTLYLYTTEEEVPVVIVRSVDFTIFSSLKKHFQGKKCIILSQDDIDNGLDIFPLKFLHIQTHSELFSGEDVFADIVVEPKDLRLHIERFLRNMLVDIREAYLCMSLSKSFYNELSNAMDIVWEGMLVLKNKDIPLSKKEKIHLVNDVWDCNSDVFLYLDDKKYVSKHSGEELFGQIHSCLEELCQKINDFIQ